jgi:hypothetical protein
MFGTGLDLWRIFLMAVLIAASALTATNLYHALKHRVVRWQLGDKIVSVDKRIEPKSFWLMIFVHVAFICYGGYLLLAVVVRHGVEFFYWDVG